MSLKALPTWNLTMADAAVAHTGCGSVVIGLGGFAGFEGGFEAGMALGTPDQSDSRVDVRQPYGTFAAQSLYTDLARSFNDNFIRSSVS